MTKKEILLKLKQEINKKGFKDINYPQEKDIKHYIWIGTQDEFIGHDKCHYEFIFDGKNLSCEVHLYNKDFFSNIMLPDYLCLCDDWNGGENEKARIKFIEEKIKISDEQNIIDNSIKLLTKLHKAIGSQLIEILQTHPEELLPKNLQTPRIANISNKITINKKFLPRTTDETKIINTKHGEIQTNLLEVLNNKGYSTVNSENTWENRPYKIDILAKKKNKNYDIFEIKPYATATECLKEALGQILFYEHLLLQEQKQVDKLYIIGPSKISNSEKSYFYRIIKKNTNIKYLNLEECKTYQFN